MATYLTALQGQHNGQDVAGLLWNVEPGQNIRHILEHLRAEAPWIGARQSGREIFTLTSPDDPEADHLRGGKEGGWKVDFRQPGSRGLLLLRILAHLRARKILVDLRTGFVAVRTTDAPEGRLIVDGLELHLEALGETQVLLWAHPLQRSIDVRPDALKAVGHRSADLWFPLEGVSLASTHPKRNDQGWSIAQGRRARLVRTGDPCAVILSENPSDLTAQETVSTLRSWFAGADISGLTFSSDPCPGEALDLIESDLPGTEACALLSNDEEILLPDVFHAALGGHTALRTPRLPPQNFHLVAPGNLDAVAHALNHRAADWPGVCLQFTTEPIEGSLDVPLEAKSPLLTQPRSGRAAGQAAALFLECVRRSGGSPWRLKRPGARWSLGISQAFLYGKMHHLSFALLDPSGDLVSSAVVPFRFADLADADFAHGIARRLWETQPEDLVLHLDETLDPPPAFLAALAPRIPAWKIRRRSVPRAFGASTFDWLDPSTVAVSDRHVLARIEREDGIRPLALERLAGKDDPLVALEEILVLEFAWTPGRAERRHAPATLEWARGLLFQKERYLPLAQPGQNREKKR
ncbi:MAG: hypothetical protein H6686_11445 [Fibrobacteria bacterium]|nr:hypothetical protein [Fibrobacteria bacterium]